MIRPRTIAVVLAGLTGCAHGRREPAPSPPAPPPASLAPAETTSPPVAPTTTTERIRPPHTIYRDELEQALAAGPGWLLRQLEPTPHRSRGRFVGWTINAVFPDAPELCAPGCDLVVGDVILRVNGESLETPDAFSRAFERAHAWTSLELVRLRDGTSEHVLFRVLDPPPATTDVAARSP